MSSIQSLGKFLNLPTLHEGAGGSDTVCPFDIYVLGRSSDYLVTIHPGTVNGLLVSNYATGVSVPFNSTRYLAIRCLTSNGTITSALLGQFTTPPDAITVTESSPPTTFDVLVGIINDGVDYKIWTCANILATTTEVFRVQKPNPSPGELPYTIWYTWSITAT